MAGAVGLARPPYAAKADEPARPKPRAGSNATRPEGDEAATRSGAARSADAARARWPACSPGAFAFVVAYATIKIPDAERPGQRPGLDHLLRRRQDRAGPASARSTASRCRCRRCPKPCRRPRSPPRTATSTATPASRRPASPAPSGSGPRGGADPGRLDDHPAVRQELLPHPGPHADPEGKEIIISVKIDKQKRKDQILENYLNTIYYGRGAYGIQTASKAYFDKDVSQLTVAEGALLASVIARPSLYDPGTGRQAEGQR